MINRDHLWKAAFRLFMQDFVRFFFPDKYDLIDWSKGIEFLDKELYKLQTKSLQQDRIADVLVRLCLKTGETIWVLLHIEVQGYLDTIFDKRMHQMRYRIEDLFGVNPAMFAIYTDDDPQYHPKQYELETWGTTNRTAFLTYKVMDVPPSMFPIQDSPVAIIMEIAYHATQAKKMSDEDIIKLHLPIVKQLLSKGFPKEQVRFLLSFVKTYLKFENSDNIHIFEQKIDDMVKYDTTKSILAKVESDRMKYLKWLAKETARKEFEKREEEHKLRQEQLKLEKEQAQKLAEQEREQTILLLIGQGIDRQIIASSFKMSFDEILDIEIKHQDSKLDKGIA
jgi:hypothetical protein